MSDRAVDSTYSLVTSVEEALRTAREYSGRFRYLAGGTDLMILKQQELVPQPHWIDVSALPELQILGLYDERLVMGSMVTLDKLIQDEDLCRVLPLIPIAARCVATPVVRKTATLGGNLLLHNRCIFYNQSQFWRRAIGTCVRNGGEVCQAVGTDKRCYSRNVSDMAPALIALEAQALLQNEKGRKKIPLEELYSGDGLQNHRHLGDDGLLIAVEVPVKPVDVWYRKLRLRRSLDFSSLTVAAAVDTEGNVRVCMNGVSMAPVLVAGHLSELDVPSLQSRFRRACKVVDNDHLPLEYRKKMMNVYIEDWWSHAAARRKGP